MNANATITLVTSSRFGDHDIRGEEHPEVAARLQCISDQLQAGNLAPLLRYVEPTEAGRQWLLTFHNDSWLFRFEEEVLSGRSFIGHQDNQVCYETFAVAQLAAGAAINGVDLVEGGSGGPVFCAVRPPGHHAEPNLPLGFCFLNNCVIAARYWQKQHNRRRLCVLDFDAHHGNGIQTAFEEDREVLYISIHEHPSFSFPGTGFAEETCGGRDEGGLLNVPLQPGAGDEQVIAALDGKVAERLAGFRPEALIIAAGFDGHREDDMSGLNYSTALYQMLGERIGGWAREHAGGRVLSILEGGYHLPSLAASVEAYLTGLHSVLAEKN
ncbi:MAG TPA: histone deacetylase [Desulfobulbaceae bacterium]|nr:histone deacetylase [Desulfobulbaceae bacterium]